MTLLTRDFQACHRNNFLEAPFSLERQEISYERLQAILVKETSYQRICESFPGLKGGDVVEARMVKTGPSMNLRGSIDTINLRNTLLLSNDYVQNP